MNMIYTENSIAEVAQKIIEFATSKTLCFYGEMGAGKTTLIKALVKEIGNIDVVSSPTFGIVNEYQYENGDVLGYHFDFYRLNDETEALDLGFEDYFNENIWQFIEWPEKISSLLPDNKMDLSIKILNTSEREINF